MLLAAGLALLLASAQDSARVRASLTAGRVAAGGSTVLAIEVITAGPTPDEIPVPVLPPGLDLGSVSDYSELQVAFPGGRRRVTRREIAITATSAGSYRIPAVEVRVSGKTLRTRALQLVVTAARAGAPLNSGTSGVRLLARATPAVAYVGQQVLYEVEAVFPEQLRLRQPRPPNFEPPVPTGFWTYDLPEPITVTFRTLGGEAAEIQRFRQVLFPLAAGNLSIPPARLQYEVRQGVVFTPQVHTLATQPVALRIIPLPAGAPASFAGAVGNFSISAGLTPSRTLRGEPVTLRLTIEGTGNIKAVTRPPLDSIPGVDAYPGGERLQLGYAGSHVSGRKFFDWTLVPRHAGTASVPAVTWAWFDPDARQYRIATTPAFQLAVRGTAGEAAGSPELAPLRTEQSGALAARVLTPSFALLQLFPPMLLAAVWGARRRAQLRARRRPQPPQEPLPAAISLADARADLERLARWLARQPDTPARARLLERVRVALYAPGAPPPALCAELLREARALQDASPAGGPGPALVLVGLVCALAGGNLVAVAGDFELGLIAFRTGDYRQAAGHFARQAASTPADPVSWYDLGNASYLAGDSGRASWAWLKALRLQPRDGWSRRNLRVADARGAERELAPRVPLATAEAAGGAAALWWFACGLLAIAAAYPSRRRLWARAGGVAALILIPLLGLLTVRWVEPERAVTLAPSALQAAPNLRAEAVRTLSRSAPLIVIDSRGDWLLVQAGDLRRGWVERRNVALL